MGCINILFEIFHLGNSFWTLKNGVLKVTGQIFLVSLSSSSIYKMCHSGHGGFGVDFDLSHNLGQRYWKNSPWFLDRRFFLKKKAESLKNTTCSNSGEITSIFFSFLFFFFVFCRFRAASMTQAYGGSQARGLIRATYSCWSTPQPQQHHIRAAYSTYTTAHGNTGSLTHWVRPGIEPAISWFLVGFISAAPRRELPIFCA